MRSVPYPILLKYASHYRQGAGKHPRPNVIAPSHETVELMTGGHGWVRHHGEWRELFPGDLIWHSPGDETIGRSDFDNPYRCLSATFRVRRVRGMGMPRFSKWPDIEGANALANEAAQLMLDDSFDQQLLRDYLFTRLLFQVRLSERASHTHSYPVPLRAVIQRIENDFAGPLPLNDLAREAGWSTPYLHEAFRRHLQTTPHQMLLRRRLRAAKERLISTPDSMKRIAVECGFADTAALGHAFKTHTGLNPTAYRERHLRVGSLDNG